jgi:hypothetical protein
MAGASHGQSRTRLYRIWSKMRSRCRGTHSKVVEKYYSDRGITVCDEWDRSFSAFRDWALANGYSDTLTIDRRESHKGYSPDNCRWATRHQQSLNRKRHASPRKQSRFSGVSKAPHQPGKWRAQACLNGKSYHLGTFACEEQAALAYDLWALDHFGEYACLNFPAVRSAAS